MFVCPCNQQQLGLPYGIPGGLPMGSSMPIGAGPSAFQSKVCEVVSHLAFCLCNWWYVFRSMENGVLLMARLRGSYTITESSRRSSRLMLKHRKSFRQKLKLLQP